ncbi:MAG: hypothetical protein ACXAB7_22700 [Candidatus Kariarchaeaceae archaeon]|jgi:hypothetical protein
MAEATSAFDLDNIKKKQQLDLLKLKKYSFPIYHRPKDLTLLVVVIMVILSLAYRVLQEFSWLNVVILVISLLGYQRQKQVKGTYLLTKDGIIMPFTWLSRTTIQWKQIVSVSEEEFIEKTTNKIFKGIRIEVDTPLIIFNTTGMTAPTILLSSKDYLETDLVNFAKQIQSFRQQIPSVPNTLAQRLIDQVDRSWSTRYHYLMLQTIDSVTELLFIIILLDGLLRGIFDYTVFPLLGGGILLGYTLIVLLYQYLEKPAAIIGIRPHELGAILYDDSDIITTIRFILISRPHTVKLINCELIYQNESLSQIDRFKQIHPETILPGELTYCIAQIYGNHTKSDGAKIQFSYGDQSELVFEVPIYWN